MIKENISQIKERISLVCSRINRKPESITIVAVAKGRSLGQIQLAVGAGIIDIGENRVQEALIKYNDMQKAKISRPVRWHLVGHLQTNKVKDAVSIFDLIHSVDSIRLAEIIDKEANKINKVQDILLQVNTSGEGSKYGFNTQDVIKAMPEIGKLSNINLKGLMTIAPLVSNPEETRAYFRQLRQLRDKINSLKLTAYSLQLLSMGMTDDFGVSIEEGSNVLRLGRAVFDDWAHN